MPTWKGEKCKNCGRPYKTGFKVSDVMWREIVPKRLQNKNLCLDCFDNFCQKKKIRPKIKIYWAGFIEMNYLK
ncbi:MAG: hypothetical protein ACKKMS_00040 [Candidatus Nealsonbacteria bacterium]